MIRKLIYIFYIFICLYYASLVVGTCIFYWGHVLSIATLVLSVSGLIASSLMGYAKAIDSINIVLTCLRVIIVITPLTFALTELTLLTYSTYTWAAIFRDVGVVGALTSILTRRYFIIKRGVHREH